LQNRAFANKKMKFVWDSVVSEILGDKQQGVQGVRLKNVNSEDISELETDGVFIFIGHIPNTQIFKGQLDMDETGIIITDRRQRTSVPGVFAAGDVQDNLYRQAVTSAGAGAAAAMEAEKFIAELEGTAYPGKLE
ncbi:MAG: FAD-dependent oxidoreductase, partial [bacterium]|nr:FAD-dependent oxidoreductase [bacterium]